MTFDWHFECGNSTKHNNWSMHSFAMLLLHADGTWSKDRLEEELTSLATTRNTILSKKIVQTKEGDVGVVSEEPVKGEPLNLIINVRRVPKDELNEIRSMFIPDEEDTDEAEAWIAEVGFREKPTEEQLKRTEAMLEKDGREAIMQAIQHAKKGHYLVEESKGNLSDLLSKLLSCNGLTINPLESMYLIDLFMTIPNDVHSMAAEFVTKDMLAIAQALGYSVASGNSFQIY